jgi:SOS-response transcriptional repressor LexA
MEMGGIGHVNQTRVLGYRAFQVVRYVETKLEEDGMAPSYGMICRDVGISTKGEVHRIVKSLERRGVFRRVGAGRVRRIRLKRAAIC